MSATALTADLIAWMLQATLVLSVGLLLPVLFRLRDARARLAYSQALLAASSPLPRDSPSRSLGVPTRNVLPLS